MTAYATLAQLKDYVDIDTANTDDDALLTMALDNASAIIDTQTHRTFAAAIDSTRTHDALCHVEGRRLWLVGDLAAVTSVTNGNGAVVPPTAYVSEPLYETPYFALTLKRSSSIAWTYNTDPEGAIAVTGKWAYSVTPPAPIVQATLRLSAFLYRQRDNALDLDRTLIVGNTTMTPAQLPADVRLILQPYIKVVL